MSHVESLHAVCDVSVDVETLPRQPDGVVVVAVLNLRDVTAVQLAMLGRVAACNRGTLEFQRVGRKRK